MPLQTLTDIFFEISGHEQPECLLRRINEAWAPISARQLARKIAGTALGLRGWGISRGDRVAILSENRHEWVAADFACMLLGAVVVPIYTTLTAQQTANLLRDSGARAIFVSSEKHLEKVLSISGNTQLSKVVVMDEVDSPSATKMSAMTPAELPPELEAMGRSVQPDDLATIIYTSGTTGTPKGVMLSHGNMAQNINYFCRDFGFRPGMTCVSFLPLSHVTARCVDLALLGKGVTLAHLADINQLSQALLRVRPHILLSVPRVYEKVHSQVELKAAGFPKRQILKWALRTGRKNRDKVLAGIDPSSLQLRLAHRLVYSKIRAGIGGRAQLFISGGAPLGRELAEWYADVGICIREGYGLTETSPVIAVNTPRAHRIGSVGKPLGNVEVRIADDGEILVRGPSVFKGYWNQPDETRKAFVDDWFKTGDIGRLDEEGFLYVTDRKKDLLKTSGGKFISPQPIEISLKHNPWIAEAVVIGDKRRFPSVLLLPSFLAVEDWAREQGIGFTSREDLVANQRVRGAFEKIISDFNQSLAQFEKLKKFTLLTEDFSSANGTMTASMKVRRRAVEERFRKQIEEMYAGADSLDPRP